METKDNFSHIPQLSSFLSYLWGMETNDSIKRVRRRAWVLILPMRNGNETDPKFVLQLANVLILPMRNGNTLLIHYINQYHRVLILPMRNGNILVEGRLEIDKWVLILPMRNGNTNRPYKVYIVYKFLSYLWGMETRECRWMNNHFFGSYPTYEEWKQQRNKRLLVTRK